MKLENIYTSLKDIVENGEVNVIKYQKLVEKLEDEIRKQTSYKTSGKTRTNAIKRVASKRNDRPALTGYGIVGDYKVITDSYHLIAIKQDDIPLKLVATKDELKELGINIKEYRKKYGDDSLINATYPNVSIYTDINKIKENEDITEVFNLDDLLSFIKLHKKEKNAIYQIGKNYVNPIFVKNVIDVLGEDVKVYYTGEYSPIYFINKDNEIGLVLPIKKY